MESVALQQRVWQVLGELPVGKVAGYGQIARLAGAPGAARQVGRILSQLPENSTLPWHRVVNASGRISFPIGSAAYLRQKELLEAEGVVFKNERICLRLFQWQP